MILTDQDTCFMTTAAMCSEQVVSVGNDRTKGDKSRYQHANAKV